MIETILITGATGLIGAATAQKFIDAGYGVVGLDVNETPPLTDANFRYVCTDVVLEKMTLVLDELNPTAIIHCAAHPGGKSFEERLLTRDHVIPLSKGGKDHWMNVVSACRRCNQFKGNKLLDDTHLELLALPYTPNHAEYLALINSHRIRSDQMEFLRPSFSRQSRLR